ncbi:MAG: LLM class flavin-dependent oxidoreductase [Chloroflexota bacterium]
MVEFGWMLPTGNQRMPDGDYTTHLHQVLSSIEGNFHAFWMPDHLMDGALPIPESLSTLSYLAGTHPSLHFGTCVIGEGYRNPALLAKTAATLQNLSGGRFILGVGAGWKADEYDAYGYPFPKTSERIEAMAETVQICKALWNAGGEPISFAGKHHHIADATCVPQPTPPPPIMIGGTGEKRTLRAVAQYADWWNIPGAPPHVVQHKSAVLAKHCADVGRAPADIRRTWMGVVSIAETEATAEAALSGFPIWDGDRALVGTPSQVLDQLQAYMDLGISYFILSFVDEPSTRGMDLFMRHVISAY